MTARFYVERPLHAGAAFELPDAQARHVQVLRLQPGDAITLFDGAGGEWQARVLTMGRTVVEVGVDAHVAVDRELACAVTIAFGMPANERMDGLVEKATELGVAAIQPLVCERSVLRLSGERAAKRVQHWHQVVIAASEQSGRTRLPTVAAVQPLRAWLDALPPSPSTAAGRIVLSPDAVARWSADTASAQAAELLLLSGPEGGLSAEEFAAARATGFNAVSLGARVLRADTAPLAVLAWCALGGSGGR